MDSYRSAFLANVIARIVGICARFISIPIAVSLLSPEQFGLWFLLSSFTGWLSFATFGVPASVQNQLAIAIKEDNKAHAKAMVSFAFGFLTKVSAAVASLVVMFGLMSPWGRLFHLSPSVSREFVFAFIVVGLSAAIQLPAKLGQSICNAHGRIALPAIADLVCQVSVTLFLVFAYCIQWKSILILVVCFVIGLVGGSLFLSITAIRLFQYTLSPVPLDRTQQKQILGKGVLFLLTGIGELLIMQTDAVVVGAVLGSASIASLMVPLALWSNVLQLQNTFLTPLWPVLTRHYFTGNFEATQKALNRASIASGLIAVASSVAILLLGRWLISLWTSGNVNASFLMISGISLYILVSCFDNLLATVLNAFDAIQYRFKYTLLFGITKVSIAACVVLTVGIDWLPLAFAMTMFLCSTCFAWWGVSKRMTELRNRKPQFS